MQISLFATQQKIGWQIAFIYVHQNKAGLTCYQINSVISMKQPHSITQLSNQLVQTAYVHNCVHIGS